MGKHLVYVAGAFVIIMILCAVTLSGSKKSTSTQKQVVTQKIDNVQIDDDNTVTTNIWDYIRSQQEDNTIGDSNDNSNNSNNNDDDEPHLTIVLK